MMGWRTCGATLLAAFAMNLGARAWAVEPAAAHPYSGDFFHRSTLTGDWGGARNTLAEKGITLDMSVTQVGQGVVSGGKDSSWQYGGRGGLTGHLDTQKLGLWPGILTVELEGNWTDSVQQQHRGTHAGEQQSALPVPTGTNVAQLPALNFAQFLSPYFGVIFGKLATVTATSGDMNEFAHGKGDTQFLNLALNFNSAFLFHRSYSPLGAGVIVLPTRTPTRRSRTSQSRDQRRCHDLGLR